MVFIPIFPGLSRVFPSLQIMVTISEFLLFSVSDNNVGAYVTLSYYIFLSLSSLLSPTANAASASGDALRFLLVAKPKIYFLGPHWQNHGFVTTYTHMTTSSRKLIIIEKTENKEKARRKRVWRTIYHMRYYRKQELEKGLGNSIVHKMIYKYWCSILQILNKSHSWKWSPQKFGTILIFIIW